MSGFFPERKRFWHSYHQRIRNKIVSIIDIKEFSFIDNPDEACEIIRKICEADCKAIDAKINFIDRHCLDIGAYMVLSEIVKHSIPVFTSGTIKPAIAKVVDAVDLRSDFRMGPLQLGDGHTDVWAFPQRSRRPAGTSKSETRFLDPQSSEKVSDDLVDEMDKWLGITVEHKFSPQGRALVRKIVGEVLDNAERHSDESRGDGDWKIAGFMARREGPERREYYRCHLAFLSVGTSISDSLERSADRIKLSLRNYVSNHAESFSSEVLNTIFALQDGITSDASAFEEGRGGTGLLDVLELFCGLSGEANTEAQPQLAIVSGGACVNFFPPYVRGILCADTGERQIWFNKDNSKDLSPDWRHVRTLPYRLNGTLVTMAFNLDRKVLGSGD